MSNVFFYDNSRYGHTRTAIVLSALVMALLLSEARALVVRPERFNTARAQQQALSAYFQYLGDATGKPVEALTFEDITSPSLLRFKELQAQHGYAEATIVQRLKLIKAWTRIVASKTKVGDPLCDVHVKTMFKREYRAFTPEQVSALRCGEFDADTRFLIALLLDPGVRQEEVTRITPGHLTEGFTFIKGLRGKGEQYRDIPIIPSLRPLFADYLDRHAINATQPLLKNHKRTVAKKVTAACLSVGIPRAIAHCHTFRHTFAHNLNAKLSDMGISPREIELTLMAVLGHKDPTATRVYTEPMPLRTAELMERAVA